MAVVFTYSFLLFNKINHLYYKLTTYTLLGIEAYAKSKLPFMNMTNEERYFQV